MFLKHKSDMVKEKATMFYRLRLLYNWISQFNNCAEGSHISWKIEVCSSKQVTSSLVLFFAPAITDYHCSWFLWPSCQKGNFIPILTRCEAYLTVANASLTFWKDPSYSSSWATFLQEPIKFLIFSPWQILGRKSSIWAAVILHLWNFITS